MREILFRGKRTDNGEWVEGDLFSNAFYQAKDKSNCCYILDYDKIEYDDFQSIFEQIDDYQVDHETVGQYTGLKDLEKTKVFEADILCDDESGRRFIVTWLDLECCFILKEISSDVYESMIDWCAVDDGEFLVLYKIGSVHDNPELLEVQG